MASARTDSTLGKGRGQGRQTLLVCGLTPTPAAVGARPEFQRLVTTRCCSSSDRREGGASSSSSQLETDCAIRRNTSAQRRATPYQSPNARATRTSSKRGRSLNTCFPRCRSGEPKAACLDSARTAYLLPGVGAERCRNHPPVRRVRAALDACGRRALVGLPDRRRAAGGRVLLPGLRRARIRLKRVGVQLAPRPLRLRSADWRFLWR
jgi:hypothetical protein